MRKSEEYYYDSVKNVGVGLVVAAIVAFFLQPELSLSSLIAMLVCGIIINIYGFLMLRYFERHCNGKE